MGGYLLFQSRLVPRPLASMGLVGAALVAVAAFLAMFDVAQPFTPINGLLSAPIGVYEMLLAGWLIAKGFGSPATASAPARAASVGRRVAGVARTGNDGEVDSRDDWSIRRSPDAGADALWLGSGRRAECSP